MPNVGCRIYPDFIRPTKEILQGFVDMPSSNIDDCMNRTAAVVDPAIKQIGERKGQLIGPAFTVKVPEGDNLMFHKAMDMAEPGDVIVIDAGGSTTRAIFGEIMVNYCKARGIAGIIIDGSIRDKTAIEDTEGFIVYAKGVTHNGPYKNGPGEIRGVVSIGGKSIKAGDIVVGDEDGITIIPQEDAAHVIEKTKAIFEMEAKAIKKILEEREYPRPWVDAKLEEIGCEML